MPAVAAIYIRIVDGKVVDATPIYEDRITDFLLDAPHGDILCPRCLEELAVSVGTGKRVLGHRQPRTCGLRFDMSAWSPLSRSHPSQMPNCWIDPVLLCTLKDEDLQNAILKFRRNKEWMKERLVYIDEFQTLVRYFRVLGPEQRDQVLISPHSSYNNLKHLFIDLWKSSDQVADHTPIIMYGRVEDYGRGDFQFEDRSSHQSTIALPVDHVETEKIQSLLSVAARHRQLVYAFGYASNTERYTRTFFLQGERWVTQIEASD